LNLKRVIIWTVIGTGISSVTTQLITIREFLAQFHGNEITIAVVLFSWLMLTGLGSLAAKPVKITSDSTYSLLLLFIAMLPLAQISAIRYLGQRLFIHGASPGFYSIFFYVFLIIAPYCLLTGFVLPYSQKLLNSRGRSFTSGELYVSDSIGDISGGAVFSFILVYWLKPFHTVAFGSSILLAAFFLFLKKRHSRWLFLSALVVVSAFYAYALDSASEIKSLTGQYGNITRYLESPYGRVVISKEKGQYTFWESGIPLYSEGDIMRSEEKIHYPLCQLDEISHVLLISGGLGEPVRELEKYRPERVDYIELDPCLTEAALEMGIVSRSGALNIINTDGRHYLKSPKGPYDAIIVDLPAPDTFQVNRFFTGEFFALAKRSMKSGGVLSLSLSYSPNYLSDTERKKLSILYSTARTQFNNVMVLPGREAYFICRDGELWSDIPKRLAMRPIDTEYIEGYFYGDVSRERVIQLAGQLDKKAAVNSDFEPRIMNLTFRQWFSRHGASPWYILTAVGFLSALYLSGIRREEYLLFATGFVSMGVEMLIIFTFQVIYGHVYLKIGGIVTAFLLGLLPGAFAGTLSGGSDFVKLNISEVIILILLAAFLLWISVLREDIHEYVFLAYCFVVSFFGGFQFPVAARLIGEKGSPAAGCLAADLCGASLGTVIVGTMLVPFYGVRSALAFLIIVKISSMIIINRKR